MAGNDPWRKPRAAAYVRALPPKAAKPRKLPVADSAGGSLLHQADPGSDPVLR